ncbi:hypothetical protein OE88DRAFT_1640396 [Heliocybe sulcata]|uniref:Uncharacterized protein n=1 Tax=Heliocybe sulcata TaxID=5364 RepID=A0A5C3NJZ1_9AGAM|nr:hypothetical protein OE88DRAFT_1640396 [Heliocybe sulcata]
MFRLAGSLGLLLPSDVLAVAPVTRPGAGDDVNFMAQDRSMSFEDVICRTYRRLASSNLSPASNSQSFCACLLYEPAANLSPPRPRLSDIDARLGGNTVSMVGVVGFSIWNQGTSMGWMLLSWSTTTDLRSDAGSRFWNIRYCRQWPAVNAHRCLTADKSNNPDKRFSSQVRDDAVYPNKLTSGLSTRLGNEVKTRVLAVLEDEDAPDCITCNLLYAGPRGDLSTSRAKLGNRRQECLGFKTSDTIERHMMRKTVSAGHSGTEFRSRDDGDVRCKNWMASPLLPGARQTLSQSSRSPARDSIGATEATDRSALSHWGGDIEP